MNAMLQRHCAKHIYIVPDGLRELMTDISREVLRHQPENTYVFIADYLDALMITRENARVAARLVQSITDISVTTCEFLLNTGIGSDDVDRIIAIMQQTFKKSLQDPTCLETVMPEEIDEANIISDIINEADIDPLKSEEAAKIIQKAYRNFKMRQEKEQELLSGMIDWRVAARSAIRSYKKTGVTNEEAKRAATLIKAAYKGYYTRRIMKKLLYEQKMLEKQEELLAFLEEAQARADFEETEESVRSEKEVKINYDTVIPHVIFGDSEIIDDSQLAAAPSTSNVIARHAVKLILESTYKAVGLEEERIPEAPPGEPTEEESAPETPKEEAENPPEEEAHKGEELADETAAAEPPPPESDAEAPSAEPVKEETTEADAELKQEAEPEIKQEAEPEIKQEAEPEVKQEAEPDVKQEEAEPDVKQEEAEPDVKQEAEQEIKQEEPEQTEEAPAEGAPPEEPPTEEAPPEA